MTPGERSHSVGVLFLKNGLWKNQMSLRLVKQGKQTSLWSAGGSHGGFWKFHRVQKFRLDSMDTTMEGAMGPNGVLHAVKFSLWVYIFPRAQPSTAASFRRLCTPTAAFGPSARGKGAEGEACAEEEPRQQRLRGAWASHLMSNGPRLGTRDLTGYQTPPV